MIYDTRVRKGLAIRPLMMGGSGVHSFQKTHPEQMPEALEAGTLNGSGIAARAGCGLAWMAPLEEKQQLLAVLSISGLVCEEILEYQL